MLSEYLKYVVACMRMRLDPASTARTAAAAPPIALAEVSLPLGRSESRAG